MKLSAFLSYLVLCIYALYSTRSQAGCALQLRDKVGIGRIFFNLTEAMRSEYTDFPPVFYLFFVPAVVGTVFWVLGIPFIVLGLIYWRSTSAVIRKIAVVCAALFILLDVPLFFGAGMAAPVFVILQTATSCLLALVAFLINQARRQKTAVNSDNRRPLP